MGLGNSDPDSDPPFDDPSDQGRRASVRPRDEGDFYVSVGEIVAEKYLVDRVLGVGGMAFVLSARHVQLEEHFALKFLNKEFLSQKSVVARFLREAKAACKIRSEHVARVYDVGSHVGAPFLVMEHLTGRDLATVVAEGGALHVSEAVEYAMQTCVALAVAHSHGIVHRDIKPENLFLVDHEGMPVIKLLDFGISKLALTGGEPGSRLTGQLALGTPAYMSPEQIRSTASADGRSDLWSLGVVLYELLTGAEAFQADTVTGLCAAVLEKEPRPLRDLRPDIPQQLVDVVARCMQKDPAHRFADVAELAAALLPFAPARALVSVERSSSIMQAARGMESGEHLVSSARTSLRAPSSEQPSRVALASGAPLSRSIKPSLVDVAPDDVSTPERKWGRTALVSALVIMLPVLGVLGYRPRAGELSAHQENAAATTTVAQPIEKQSLAAVPIATHVLSVSSPSSDDVDAVASAQRRAAAALAAPRPLAPRARASGKPASTDAGAAASAAPAPPGSSLAPAVELGY
jgi:eukaryotic-like serine/threonine-protein kinase